MRDIDLIKAEGQIWNKPD